MDSGFPELNPSEGRASVTNGLVTIGVALPASGRLHKLPASEGLHGRSTIGRLHGARRARGKTVA